MSVRRHTGGGPEETLNTKNAVRRRECITVLLMNVVMAATMSFAADALNGSLSRKTVLMILPGFVTGTVLSFRVPYRRFLGALDRGEQRKRNGIPLRILQTLPHAFFQTVCIGAVMTALSVLPSPEGMKTFFSVYLDTLPALFLISWMVATIAQIPVAFLAGKLIGFHKNGTPPSGEGMT